MPTVRSRDLGYELQNIMRAASMSGHELARRLDLYPSMLSHAINGHRRLSDADLVAILVACHVTRDDRERILRLNHDLTQRGWLQHHEPALSTWSRTLAHHEHKAAHIVDIQTTMVPQLLQTEDYARTALSRSLTTHDNTSESILAAHRDRQSIFSKYPPPRMLFFLTESTLHAPAGDAAMMSEQMQHLLMNAALPHVEIRIIPGGAGVHAGFTGSFTLLESDTFNPIVHLGGLSFEVFLEQPHQIEEHRRLIALLDRVALSNEASMRMISTAEVDLYRTSETTSTQ
jgi:transcriptional regulator with XRE-family HTH domain